MVCYKHHLTEPIRIQRKDLFFNNYGNFNFRYFNRTLVSMGNGWIAVAPPALVEWNEE